MATIYIQSISLVISKWSNVLASREKHIRNGSQTLWIKFCRNFNFNPYSYPRTSFVFVFVPVTNINEILFVDWTPINRYTQIARTYIIFLLVDSTHITIGVMCLAGQIKQQLPLRTGCKFVVHVNEIVSFLVRKRQPAAGSNNDQWWILVAHLQSATCWSSWISTRIIVSIYNVDVQFMNMPKLLHTS